jgi:hypothetical protein
MSQFSLSEMKSKASFLVRRDDRARFRWSPRRGRGTDHRDGHRIGLDWIPVQNFFCEEEGLLRGQLSLSLSTQNLQTNTERNRRARSKPLSVSLALFNDVANEPLFVARGRAVVSFERDAEAAL